MDFRVLDGGSAEGRAAWEALWLAWPDREVWGHPAFGGLFARPGDRFVCAAGHDAGGTILLPLLLRPLATEPWAPPGEERWDATTPYGYGGPFAWGPGPRDDAAFWRAHDEWCRDQRIVSTFLRLSLFPEQRASLPVAAEDRLPNVVVPLLGGADAIWRGYDHDARNNVCHAEKAGVETEVDLSGSRLEAFCATYEHTMGRRAADRWYFFPRTFFQSLLERLPGQWALVHALFQGEVVSSELVLCSARHVYAFLGGTRQDAFRLRPNDLLRHRTATWASEQGKKAYVLGGGIQAGDGIFRHKRAFAPHGVVPFQVAGLMHDERAMAELASHRVALAEREGRTWGPRAGFFPPYRSGGAPVTP
jgi:hypothetical protein